MGNVSHLRVLLIRLSAIGDVLNALPALWSLRAALPDAHIAWLVEDKARDAVDGQPGIDEVIVFERRRWSGRWSSVWPEAVAWLRALRARRFDVSIDLQGNLKSATLALLAGARRRICAPPGFTHDLAYLAATEYAIPRSNRQARLWHHVDLVAPLGGRKEGATGRFRVPDEALARIENQLNGVPHPRVLLHPGTSRFGAFKRWPPGQFAELARLLLEREVGAVLVGWGPGEEELARAVVSVPGVVAAPPTASLVDLAAILSRVDVFVGGDSAPLHLASLLGTPCVGLFGPKDPALYGPVIGPRRLLAADLPCRPCGLRRCIWTAGPREPSPCMVEIRPETVARAVLELAVPRSLVGARR